MFRVFHCHRPPRTLPPQNRQKIRTLLTSASNRTSPRSRYAYGHLRVPRHRILVLFILEQVIEEFQKESEMAQREAAAAAAEENLVDWDEVYRAVKGEEVRDEEVWNRRVKELSRHGDFV